jgi:basic membrane protein A
LLSDAQGFAPESFSAQAAAGLERCRAEGKVTTSATTASPPSDYEGGLVLLATENFDPVLAVGAPMTSAVAQTARRFDGTHFDLLDGVVNAPNVTSVVFADDQGAYVAGALAALVSRRHHVAFLGGEDILRLRSIAAGFAAGARHAVPGARVETAYAGSFVDARAGRRAARALVAHGVDVVYVVAGPAGLGAIDQLRDARAYAIGADADQDGYARGTVLGSVIKRFDVAAEYVCLEAISQKASSGLVRLGLADGAIGLTRSPYARRVVTPSIVARLARIEGELEDGTLTLREPSAARS